MYVQEWGIVSDPTNLYGWIDGVQNHSLIGLPYHGLRLTPADEVITFYSHISDKNNIIKEKIIKKLFVF